MSATECASWGDAKRSTATDHSTCSFLFYSLWNELQLKQSTERAGRFEALSDEAWVAASDSSS